MVTDPAALSHILITNASNWPKPSPIFRLLLAYIGNNVVFSQVHQGLLSGHPRRGVQLIHHCVLHFQGESHRRQRKGMAPLFAPSFLRNLTPKIFEKADKVRLAPFGKLEHS